MIKGKPSRPVKLTVTTALPAPLGEEGALFIEDGNALQGFIGDIDILLSIERHGHGPHDLAISGATAAKITVIRFGQRAPRNPFIAHAHVDFRSGPIQHIEQPVPSNSHINRIVKSSAPQSIKAYGVTVAIETLDAHISPPLFPSPLPLRLRRQRGSAASSLTGARSPRLCRRRGSAASSLTGALPRGRGLGGEGPYAQLRELILPHRDDQLQHVPDTRHRRVISAKV